VLTILSLGHLAAMCILAAMLWLFADAWWPATILLFIGRWIFVAPLIVLLPAAIAFRRPLVAPLVLSLVIGLGPLMGFRTGWRRVLTHPAGEQVRVVTLNTGSSNLVAATLPALLSEWAAQIVAFQECGPALKEAIQQLNGWFHHSVRGLCTLTRFPMRDSMVMDRSVFARNNNAGALTGGAADVVRYTLDLPQGPIGVTNLHLETPRKGLEGFLHGSPTPRLLRANTEIRDLESELARRWVNQGTAPALVLGDFNTPAESRIFRKSWGDLTDAFSRVGFGLGMTRNNGWIRVRIDHVLTGPGWYADRAVVGRDVGSDHWPLIVDLTIVR
jgi:endonuclease/exonuclease/phosphatase (EEP) superfamily protein YafD